MHAWVHVAAALMTFAPSLARADPPLPGDPPPLQWDDDRPRFRPIEYAATAIVGGTAIAMYYELPPQGQPHWTGGVLFDDAARDALRLRTPDALRTVWAFSDALDVALVAMVFGVDSLAVPTLRGSPDVALQLGLMDAEAYAFSSVLTIGLYDTVGRARPSYEDCRRDPSFVGCNVSPTASFPSGHTNEAFTAAGASCANHLYVPIYGGRPWDALACARDLVLATADGVFRIMGDRHYVTDVLAGAAIGFGFGYGAPTLLHYGVSRSRSAPQWTLSPMAGQRSGLILSGMF